MYIKYCTDGFLTEFKVNFDKYILLYKNKDKEGLDRLFGTSNVKEGNLNFKYTPLKTSKNSENPEKYNIKIVYESLKELTPVQAVQEKLWVAMYNTYYQDHLFDYIDTIKEGKNFEKRLKGSIVYTWGANRSKIVQNVARMWWLGYYLYDEENKKDPYELLNFYTDTMDIVGKSTVFFSSNLTNNKNLTLGILEGLRELVDHGTIDNKREYYNQINKYFNLIGGVKLLDFMSRSEAKDETIRYLLEYTNSSIAYLRIKKDRIKTRSYPRVAEASMY